MFDLFRSKKQMVRYFLGGILMLVAFSMVITLIPGIFGTPADVNAVVLAEIGDQELTIQEVGTRFRDLRIHQLTDATTMRVNGMNTIDNMIMEKMLWQEAQQFGLVPDEQELVEWLKLQLPFLFPNGAFVGKPQYSAFVRQRFQRSVPEFEAELRRDLAINTRLRRMVTSNVVVNDEQLREIYRLQNEKANLEYVAIQAADFEGQVKPTEEQLREFFQANAGQYGIPEKRTVKLMTIDESQLPEPDISDAEIEAFYARDRRNYETPERVKASHILFMTEGKSEEETTQIEARANEVLQQVKDGGDFAELAKKHSEDPGSGEQGGDLGWVVRGQMVPQFEDAVFAMASGATSDELVKTQFGFHIIKVEDRESPRLRPLAEVRDEIRNTLLEERRQIERIRKVDEAIAVARRFGDDLEGAGRELGFPVQTLEAIGRSSPPPEIAGDPQLLEAIFSATEGEVVSSAQQGQTRVAVLTAIIPSRPAEYEEVTEQVRQAYIRQEADRLAGERAEQIYTEAQETNRTLKQVAAKYGIKTTSTGFFTPRDEIPDLGTAAMFGAEAFDAEPGTIVQPAALGPRKIVYQIIEQQEADMAAFEDERDELYQQELERQRQRAFTTFAESTRRQYEEEGKIRTYPERIDSFMQAVIRRG